MRELLERILAAMDKGYMGKGHAEYSAVMEAIRAELEKPEPEPVAWASQEYDSVITNDEKESNSVDFSARYLEEHKVPLYREPQ